MVFVYIAFHVVGICGVRALERRCLSNSTLSRPTLCNRQPTLQGCCPFGIEKGKAYGSDDGKNGSNSSASKAIAK